MAENANAPAGNLPVAQKTNTPTANVSAAQTTSAPTAVTQSAPAPGSGRLSAVHEPTARDPSSKPGHYLGGCPTQEASLVAQPSLSRRATTLRLVMHRVRSWLGQLISSTSIRLLIFFCLGIAVAVGWQSYRDAGTEAITSWCGRWAPQTASAAQNVSSPSKDLVPVSPDMLQTTSLNLAAVRASIDKLADELSRLDTVEKLAAELTRLQLVEHATLERTSVPSPLVPPVPPAGRPPSRLSPSPAH